MIRRPSARELAILLAIVALAALLRLPGLDARGAWDADQGHDMLVLQALVRDGEVPLLGPRTSIGTFHHGAAYYYLLAPAAFVSGADPVAVTGELALLGIAAVVATWWLGRLIGGPLAGLAAALLLAVSPAGIEASTFIWNPNPIPFASAIAFAAAIHARLSGRARWWLLSGLGAMLVMQLHVLGIVALPPLIAAWLLDVRRRRRSGAGVRPAVLAGVGALAIIAAGYLPLLASELGHEFAETRAILDYLGGDGSSAATGVVTRVTLVGLRSITWPAAGLVTERIGASLAAALIVLALTGVAVLVGARRERRLAALVAGSVAWSVVALAVFAPSLAVVTPGLPNDHYHSFLDPLVLALAGAGLARLASGRAVANAALGRAAAAGLGVVLIAIAVMAWPPAVSPDGGWRLADEAAARVIAETGGSDVALDGIPPFKSADALRFPLEHRGVTPPPADSIGMPSDNPPMVVVVCDPLFADVVGAPCGGPAEAAWSRERGVSGLPLDRFEAGPRRVITVYRSAGG